jgi:hypothetical protein
MRKPALTAQRLLEGGFKEVGCWELNGAKDLIHSIDLPRQAGVYAFVIDGIAQYVGLASTSLHQRLGFYRRPGTSQRTNIRLNEVIRDNLSKGIVVQILIAHPADHEWNGFKVKGGEGLEAGLISQFDLPWNVRGAIGRLPEPTGHQQIATRRQSGIAQRVLELVNRRPGMTELEIAKQIYGPSALQPQVNSVCRKLVDQGRIVRRGRGHSDPYIYYPAP